MTRIVAGTAGGRRLRTPPGRGTRPTSDRAREGLFSALEAAMGPLSGSRFFDLYAGSGAVGLEALSRGAAEAVLVERDRRATAVIAENAKALRLGPVVIVGAKVEHYLATATPAPFHAVFVDPPYAVATAALSPVTELLVDRGWLHPAAVVVLERSRRDPAPHWPGGLDELRTRHYGDTVLWYGRRCVET